jgi:hypothetical protein
MEEGEGRLSTHLLLGGGNGGLGGLLLGLGLDERLLGQPPLLSPRDPLYVYGEKKINK